MLGNPIADDLAAIAAATKTTIEDDTWTSEREECITQLVLHSQLALLPLEEEALGGWALVDPFSLYVQILSTYGQFRPRKIESGIPYYACALQNFLKILE